MQKIGKNHYCEAQVNTRARVFSNAAFAASISAFGLHAISTGGLVSDRINFSLRDKFLPEDLDEISHAFKNNLNQTVKDSGFDLKDTKHLKDSFYDLSHFVVGNKIGKSGRTAYNAIALLILSALPLTAAALFARDEKTQKVKHPRLNKSLNFIKDNIGKTTFALMSLSLIPNLHQVIEANSLAKKSIKSEKLLKSIRQNNYSKLLSNVLCVSLTSLVLFCSFAVKDGVKFAFIDSKKKKTEPSND